MARTTKNANPTTDFAAHSARQAKFKYYEQRFILHPGQMSGFVTPVRLNWQTIPFHKRNIPSVSNRAGVYAFSIRRNNQDLPPHDYVLYIGQVGAKRSGARTIRARIREYFGERVRKKRPHIWEFLNKWKGVLFFHFAELDATTVNLEKIEAKLNDALVPPYSIRDFTATIRQAKKLWSLT